MLSREEAINYVFDKHGKEAVYITNTGFLSRAIYHLYPENKNILYMQGSMGLSPAIGLGIAKSTDRDIVVFVGDASLLMHLGITHTVRDENLSNLYVYVIDNGCHESVGGYYSARLEESYSGVTEIIKTNRGDKKDRVAIRCAKNIKQIKEFLIE